MKKMKVLLPALLYDTLASRNYAILIDENCYCH